MGILEVITGFLIAFKIGGIINCNWWIVMSPELLACIIYIAILVCEIKKENKR